MRRIIGTERRQPPALRVHRAASAGSGACRTRALIYNLSITGSVPTSGMT